jgi:uncharacterized membrane-anchored protein YitT (DUF2179 family)
MVKVAIQVSIKRYCIPIPRLEISKIKAILQEKDEDAFVTITDVHDAMGGRVKKKSIHYIKNIPK